MPEEFERMLREIDAERMRYERRREEILRREYEKQKQEDYERA